MARPLRVTFPGAIHHITVRGNERRLIFRSDQDRRRFVAKLGLVAGACHVPIYAYALMPNHYHLVVCTPRSNLSAFMQQLNTGYTMYFNRRHNRIGHLFSGRYKAKLVEGGDYLVRLTRYVHLNPVKTAEVRTMPVADRKNLLRSFPWSSFPAYTGAAEGAEWLDRGVTLQAFGDVTKAGAAAAYQAYVEDGVDEDDAFLLQALARSSKGVGSDAFRARMEEKFRRSVKRLARPMDIARRRVESGAPVERITEIVRADYAMSTKGLFRRGNREAKDVWMKLAHDEGGLSQRQIAAFFGHADGSTVARRLMWLSREIARDRAWADRLKTLREKITKYKA